MTEKTPQHRSGWLAFIARMCCTFLVKCGLKASAQAGEPVLDLPPPSQALSPEKYREDAARHVYKCNAQRIYHGKLPPLLKAVAVLSINLGRDGHIRSLNWQRAPRHVPQVMKEIERTVYAVAPFPIANQLGYVTYTDTWLWHESGQFQLHTLTEGQLEISE